MQLFKSFFLAVLAAATVSAAPVDVADVEEKRAVCVYHCGTVCYWQEDIDEALAKGYSLYKSGSTLGKYD